MACDLVLINHGDPEPALNAIKSVEHHLRPLLNRVIVVENGTGHADVFRMKEYEVVEFEENRGFAAGVNAGIQRSLRSRRPPRHVMLLNPDAYLVDGPWLRFFNWVVPPVAVAGPRVICPDGTVQASTYGEPDPGRVLLEAIGVHRLARRCGVKRQPSSERTEAVALQGSCLVISLEAWKQVGVMDEEFFLYHEETDWCLRARDKGLINIHDPSVSIVHGGGLEVPPGREVVYYRGALRLIRKRRGEAAASRFEPWLKRGLRLGAAFAGDTARARGLREAAEKL